MDTASEPTLPKLLTEQQATEYLNLADGTLAKWRCVKRHNIPFIRVGTSIRYRAKDLERWLEDRTVVGTARRSRR